MALELHEPELIRLILSFKVNKIIVKDSTVGYFVYRNHKGKYKWNEPKLKEESVEDLERLFLKIRLI